MGWGVREAVRGEVVAERRKLSAELEDPQALATWDDHISWSFPFKSPLVHESVGCWFCSSN